MMIWTKKYMAVKQYVFTSINQHGSRYKQDGFKRVSVARMECKYDASSVEMLKLIMLSDTLDIPVRYDWDDHTAYIEVVSGEALKEATCHN